IALAARRNPSCGWAGGRSRAERDTAAVRIDAPRIYLLTECPEYVREGGGALPESGKVAARASHGRARSAAACAFAAAVGALREPVDRRLIGCDYSDVAVLGKALAGGRAWWAAGVCGRLAHGAVFCVRSQ